MKILIIVVVTFLAVLWVVGKWDQRRRKGALVVRG